MNNDSNLKQYENSIVWIVAVAIILIIGVFAYCTMYKGARGGKVLFQPWHGVYAIECTY